MATFSCESLIGKTVEIEPGVCIVVAKAELRSTSMTIEDEDLAYQIRYEYLAISEGDCGWYRFYPEQSKVLN